MNYFYAHYSNLTESLYEQLKKSLFSFSSPFTKRMIIVPSPAMKSWLMIRMAKDPDLEISSGIEVDFVEPSIRKIASGSAARMIEPGELELALIIEVVIRQIMKTPETEHTGLASLYHYFNGKKNIDKRVSSLASTLAKCFINYGIYGGKWIEEEEWLSPAAPAKNWQKLLWQKIEERFATSESGWNYPARQFENLDIEAVAQEDMQLHVFGLSFLPPLYHRLLHKIAERFPVHYYVLSPCQKFWGDLLSDREGERLKNYWSHRGAVEKSQEALDLYLRDNNPLLANYGRLGRETSKQIEDGNPEMIESYVLSQSVEEYSGYNELLAHDIILEKRGHPLTILEAIQSDIALLRNPNESEKINIPSYDGSVQVHGAPKKAREVQVIYNAIATIIQKHKNDPSAILPGEILVMAPNISEYVPFIKSVFESTESRIGIQLLDHQVPTQYPLIRGYLHLLSLSHGRWEASAVLELFEYESFRKKFQLVAADFPIIEKWVRNTAIYWGKDSSHRQEVMENNYEQKNFSDLEDSVEGTWEHGFKQLLEGLAIASHQEGVRQPLSIESSQSSLLGSVIEIVRSLQSDLKPLANGTLLSLKEWTAYLKCLLEAYFSPIAQEGSDEGFKVLGNLLDIFAQSSGQLIGETFSFSSIYHHLEQKLYKETAVYREVNLQSVRFSSLLPMRAVPAKVIVLMGMGEGLFPRMDHTAGMNLLLNNPKADYFPESVDFDRYLFLEMLLSARNYFILSYVSQEPGDTKEILPSLLVDELLDYMDKSIAIGSEKPSDHCHFDHPLNPFHHIYFSGNSRYTTYFQSHYLAALSYYHPEKTAEHSFFTDFPPAPEEQEQAYIDTTVDLMELLALAKNPLKFYLNKRSGIYLHKESDRKVKDTEDLFFSALHSAILLKEDLADADVDIGTRAQQSGMLPTGSFRIVGLEKVEQESRSIEENLLKFGVRKDEIFLIEFNDRYDTFQISEDGKRWCCPPLVVELSSSTAVSNTAFHQNIDIGLERKFLRIKLVGKIETVSRQGLIILAEDDIEKAVAYWPAFIVFSSLVAKHQLPVEQRVIFAKGEKPRERILDFESPDMLIERYVRYYFKAKASPSPMAADWVSSILSGDASKIEKKIESESENSFRKQFDDYRKWLERSSPRMTVGPLDHWQPVARYLFDDVLSNWYST